MRKLILSMLLLSGAMLNGVEISANLSTQEKTQEDIVKAQHHTYISVAASGSPNNAQTVALNDPIIFNNTISVNGDISNDDIAGVITTSTPGTYEVTYGAQFADSPCGGAHTSALQERSQIALRVNGEIVSGSTLAGNGLHSLTLIVDTKNPITTFEVINNSQDSQRVFHLFKEDEKCYRIRLDGDNTNNSTTAFITIRKI